MPSNAFTESVVEDAALAWLEAAGWRIAHGPDISPVGDTLTPALSQRGRESYSDVVLAQRLRDALTRLNLQLPAEALSPAISRRVNSQVADAAPCRASRHWALRARSRFA